MDKNLVKYSKFLSLILRHQPEKIGLQLDDRGWADVDPLLALANLQEISLTRTLLEEIVTTNDKQRFIFNSDRSKIRANQGHSIAVNLSLKPQKPPTILFHGTATRFIDSICDRGLLAGNRQHVHLSAEESTALAVGKRHGKAIVLRIRAAELNRDGFEFYLSANGVWLTNYVPVKYIEFPK
jgi:putative RNA 2'-phosphotransferase